MKPQRIALWLALAILTACSSPTTPPANTAATGAAVSPAPATPAPNTGTASSVALATQALKTQEAADNGTPADSSETKLERVAALSPEGQLPAGGPWVAGKNYQPLVPAQPSNAPPGKVEVTEVFWYACPHCYALEPYLEKWAKTKPAYIQFDHVPVMWGDVHRATARLYYTLVELGKEDALRAKVFDEIHQKRDPLVAPSADGTTVDPAGTLKLQLAFAEANGISAKDFTAAYNSFAVQTDLTQAEDLGERYKVEGVPLIVIDGKYETDVGMAGGEENLIKLIDYLAASEKNRNP